MTPGSASLESAEAAPHLTGQHVFIDIASATPKLKQGVADRLSGTNALLADGSIMGTPKDGFAMPILASGPAAERVRDALVPWGMRIEAVGDFRNGIRHQDHPLRADQGHRGAAGRDAADGAPMALTIPSWTPRPRLSRPWMETVNSLIPTGVIHAQRRTEEVEMAARRSRTPGSSRS